MAATEIYVDSSASPGGDGSIETPYDSIFDVTFADDMTVYIKSGTSERLISDYIQLDYTYSSGGLTLTRYGTGDDPVLTPLRLQSGSVYTEDLPISGNFADQGSNIWRAVSVASEDHSVVRFNGDIIGIDTGAAAPSAINEFRIIDDTGLKIEVYAESNPDTFYTAVEEVGQRYSIRVFDSYTTIDSMKFIGSLRNCVHAGAGTFTNVSVQNCDISMAGEEAVLPSQTNSEWLITRNDIGYNDLNGDGEGAVYLSNVHDSEVSFNIIHHTKTETGIGFKVGSSGNIATGNIIYKNGQHGVDISGAGSEGKIYNNTIVFNGQNNASASGINQEATGGDVSDIQIFNNICFNNGLISLDPEYSNSAELGEQGYNDYFSDNQETQDFLRWFVTGYNSTETAAWESASGDSNSIYVDPEFNDPSSGDFQLKSGSEALNAGVTIAGVNDTGTDIFGNPAKSPPNIGAYWGDGEGGIVSGFGASKFGRPNFGVGGWGRSRW